MPVDAYDLDHVALAAADTTPLLLFLTGELSGTVLFGGHNVGFRPMQVMVGDELGGMKVELLEPWQPESNDFLARFLDARGPGPHHLTYKVPDIVAALDRARAAGFEPVNVNIDNPMWKEAFLHPRQSHGTVVQLAESHEDFGTRLDQLARARQYPNQGNPRWWNDPLPPTGPPAHLRRVVIGVRDLAAAAGLHRELLCGAVVESSDDVCELEWPGGARVRLEQRPGSAAVDRLEVEGLSHAVELLGTRFVPSA